MHLSVYEQSELFRYAFLFGVFLGIFYDVFRLLRAVGCCSRRALFLQDVVFMIGCSILCFLFAQTTVHGHFRMFIMAAHLLGFLSYRMSAGLLTKYIFNFFGIIYKAIIRTVDRIFVFLAGIIRKISTNLSIAMHGLHITLPISDKK